MSDANLSLVSSDGRRILPVGIFRGIPHDEYHSDPCEKPSLSAHVAMEVVNHSLGHAHEIHPRLGRNGSSGSTKEQTTGTILHSMLLGGDVGIVEIDAPDFKTKKAQEARDEALAAGKVPIVKHRMAILREAADAVRASLLALGYDFGKAATIGSTELTAVWKSGLTWCRARIDSLFADACMIVDLKTTEDAMRASDGRNIVSCGYHIQAASNIDAIETHMPEMAGRVRFVDLFVEWERPKIGIVQREIKGEMLELGQRQWRRAIAAWGPAVESNIFPGYPSAIEPAICPPWALAADMERQIGIETANAGTPPFMA